MNIYKVLTEYTDVQGQVYPSEVFVPGHMTAHGIIKTRSLPNEVVVGEPELVSHNGKWNTEFKLNKECVAHYVWKNKYLDAAHRVMYLITIKGQDEVDIFDFHRDDGLLHQLIHAEKNYIGTLDGNMVAKANVFELTVPGTFLWALAQIKP